MVSSVDALTKNLTKEQCCQSIKTWNSARILEANIPKAVGFAFEKRSLPIRLYGFAEEVE